MPETLTTERVRDLYSWAYAWDASDRPDDLDLREHLRTEFTAWLATHDAELAERAWREGYSTGKRDYAASVTGGVPISTPNPCAPADEQCRAEVRRARDEEWLRIARAGVRATVVPEQVDLCDEEVVRRGEVQPCEKPAVALRLDLRGDTYPVCPRHTRRPMVPLSEVVGRKGSGR